MKRIGTSVLLGALPTMIAIGCGDPSNGASSSGASDASHDVTADEVATPTPAPQTFVRFAQLSPDAPAFDFCLAPHGTTDFQGPIVSAAGTSAGISFGQVSSYFSFDAGSYDVRVVVTGAACAPSNDLDGALDGNDDAEQSDASADADANVEVSIEVPDTTNLPFFSADSYATILIVGDLAPAGTDPSIALSAISDDSAPLVIGGAGLRAVNAVPSAPLLDFGFGSFTNAWLPLLTSVAFGEASTQAAPSQGAVDANGYLPMAPFDDQQMSARLSSALTTDMAVATDASIASGSSVTLFAIGGKTGAIDNPPTLLSCVDNAPSGTLFSSCTPLR